MSETEQRTTACVTMAAAIDAGVTIEDLARALASIDGKRDAFDEGKGISVFDDKTGHYAGYMVEAEEQVKRATAYAMDRKR